MKDRLQYCLYWKKNVDLYLANKEISKKTDDEYYRTRPLLKLILVTSPNHVTKLGVPLL